VERTSLNRDVTEWKQRYTSESGVWKQESHLLREENKELRAECSAVNERASGLQRELELMKKSSGMGAEKQLEILVKMQMDNEVLRKQHAEQGMCRDLIFSSVFTFVVPALRFYDDLFLTFMCCAVLCCGAGDLSTRLAQTERKMAEMAAKAHKMELLRRKLHNTIQELKGNIRVITRVRPALAHDGVVATSPLQCIAGGAEGQNAVKLVMPEGGAAYEFAFDQVFGQKATQEVCFCVVLRCVVLCCAVLCCAALCAPKTHSLQLCIAPQDVSEEVSSLVQSALDGYNVCLFSYGQTGSGKTHTMQGSGQGAMRGIIPRAVAKIMEQAATLSGEGWQYTLEASFLEVRLYVVCLFFRCYVV
jgi:hypothetical protein